MIKSGFIRVRRGEIQNNNNTIIASVRPSHCFRKLRPTHDDDEATP